MTQCNVNAQDSLFRKYSGFQEDGREAGSQVWALLTLHNQMLMKPAPRELSLLTHLLCARHVVHVTSSNS